MNQVIPQVDKVQTKNFSNIWRYNGLAIALDDVHVQFATDFANVVLANFVLQCQAQVQQAIQAQQAQNQAGNPAEQKGLIVEA